MTCPRMELNLGQVLVAVPEGATPAQVATLQAKAERALARVPAGEDFARLAREMSDAPGAANTGGQMGLRPVDRYPQLFINAVQALPDGGISGVVRSGAGFHVLKVIEKRQAGMPGINVTQSRARHILLRPTAQLSESAARERLARLSQAHPCRHGRLCPAGARVLPGRQRTQRRRPGLGQPRPVRARV
jgi:peptidyl-prolyl cis-trans isomerase SurA